MHLNGDIIIIHLSQRLWKSGVIMTWFEIWTHKVSWMHSTLFSMSAIADSSPYTDRPSRDGINKPLCYPISVLYRIPCAIHSSSSYDATGWGQPDGIYLLVIWEGLFLVTGLRKQPTEVLLASPIWRETNILHSTQYSVAWRLSDAQSHLRKLEIGLSIFSKCWPWKAN